MNILLLNGSPKGQNSNSLQLAEHFVKGVCSAAEARVERVDLAKLKIGHCMGCYGCWTATPGQCVLQDDMAMVMDKMVHADRIVYSFPLYYYNVPGMLKNAIDRMLPTVSPMMAERQDGLGSGSHEARVDRSHQKYALISTCGFYSAQGNYDSVLSMFDHICGKGNYEYIFCGQGELFRVPQLKEYIAWYLDAVEKAGAQWARGDIEEDTKKQLQQLLFPKEVFEQMANGSWGNEK